MPEKFDWKQYGYASLSPRILATSNEDDRVEHSPAI
jgi:hypothetical protein